MKKSLFLCTDILCFSPSRWNFVYQRPQHLMTRFAQKSRVYYIEDPLFDAEEACYTVQEIEGTQLKVLTPHLPSSSLADPYPALRSLLEQLIMGERIRQYICWYYSPMALQYSAQLHPLATVYDCIQDVAASQTNTSAARQYEALLFEKADVVFTAGHHLFESHQHLHRNIYSFPNSIDKSHFTPARLTMAEPADQIAIPHPRIGFYGVLDERLNTSLLSDLAGGHPEWQFIFIGPVANAIQGSLPKQSNVHLLGAKEYNELPQYLSGWDVAMIPFALNDGTRYINPAITPEFLAAGKPVVATPVYDIVHPYGKKGLVQIASTTSDFARAIEKALQLKKDTRWLGKVDRFLSNISWDKTFRQMEILTEATMERKRNMFRPLKKALFA